MSISFRIKLWITCLIRNAAWWVIHRTDGKTKYDEPPHIIFRHRKCGSWDVEPLPGEMGFQCLGCGSLVPEKNVEFRLVRAPKPTDKHVLGMPSALR